METIKLSHGRLNDIDLQLSSVEWCKLRLPLTVLDPPMYVEKKLECNKVIGSLVVLLIWDFRTSLTDVLAPLKGFNPCRGTSPALCRIRKARDVSQRSLVSNTLW